MVGIKSSAETFGPLFSSSHVGMNSLLDIGTVQVVLNIVVVTREAMERIGGAVPRRSLKSSGNF